MLTRSSGSNWTYEAAAHLLNRAGFGGTPDEIKQLHGLGLDSAVESLLSPPDEPDDVTGRSWTTPQDLFQKRQDLRDLKSQPALMKQMRQGLFREQQMELSELRLWWLERMQKSRAPLIEKMTLFWHGHFATSAQKSHQAYAMWQQNETFRRHALGNFSALLKAVSRDPAMMIYLDLQQSRKEHPNENWARESMELFTLGIGHYTERDVRESARAFTGYQINAVLHKFRFGPLQHDESSKTFLGQVGNFSGDDILDIIVRQPACPQFIGRKIWRFFVEDEPSTEAADAIAESLRRNDFELRPVLREIFLSADFYSDRIRRTQIKSPVQFLVQSCKLLETEMPSSPAVEGAMAAMGQILLSPPNVKGWDGGKAWVSTSTLLFRYNFANYLLEGTSAHPAAPPALQRAAMDLAKIVPADLRKTPEKLVATLSKRLYQAPVAPKHAATLLAYLQTRPADLSDGTMRHLLHLMMSTPEFQLT